MDAATGLLYVGNGQYYDPETGRFLTRDAKPNNSNPYVPWDPTGAIIGPLGIAALFFARRKKGNTAGTLLVLFWVAMALSLTLAACGGPLPEGQMTATVVSTPGVPTAVATATFADGSTSTAVIPWPTEAPTQMLGVPCQTLETPIPVSTSTPIPLDSILESYGVRFIGNMAEWTSLKIDAVRDAVVAVAERMAQVAGGGRSPLEVFRLVYEGVNFSWGTDEGASGTCLTIQDGACTSGAHNINFVDWLDTRERARNNVVHELGHAFAKNWSESGLTSEQLEYYRQHPEETNPAIVLAWAQSYPGLPEHYVPGFPDRQNPTSGQLGDYSGFASQQNQLTWQMAVTNAGDPAEEFADQFLGWTFDTWQRRADGSFTSDATLRRNFMDRYMPGWITYRINH